MALLERHRYMISRLADAFGREEPEIEKLMLQPDVILAVNNFFSAEGPTKILVALEEIQQESSNQSPPSSRSKETEVSEEATQRLRIFIDEIDYIPSATVFFMKNRRPKDNKVKYAIDPAKSNDGAVTFGVIRAPLESLEAMMRCVYKPMIQNMPDDNWGYASPEHKAELLSGMETFTKGLQESIRSISGGLELRKPDDRLETLGPNAAADPSLVTQSLNLLQEWCQRIEKYLDDSDRSRWETPDSGPDTELYYWRNRTQR